MAFLNFLFILISHWPESNVEFYLFYFIQNKKSIPCPHPPVSATNQLAQNGQCINITGLNLSSGWCATKPSRWMEVENQEQELQNWNRFGFGWTIKINKLQRLVPGFIHLLFGTSLSLSRDGCTSCPTIVVSSVVVVVGGGVVAGHSKMVSNIIKNIWIRIKWPTAVAPFDFIKTMIYG